MNLENILGVIILVFVFGIAIYFFVFPRNTNLKSNFQNYKFSKNQERRITEHLQKIENVEKDFPQVKNFQDSVKKSNGFQDSVKNNNPYGITDSWESPFLDDDILRKKSRSEEYRELYELYFKGIPEKYANDGSKIPGVEPNAEKAIENLEKVIQEHSKLGDPESEYETIDEDILNLAKIYHFGMHKFEPILDSAEKVYSYLLQFAKTNEGLQEAQNGLSEINKIRTHKWLNLDLEERPRLTNNYNNGNTINNPLNILITEHDLADEIEDVLDTRFRINPGATRDLEGLVDDNTFNMNVILLAEANRNLARQNQAHGQNDNIRVQARRGTRFYDDSQNVHDSQVVSTVKHSIDKLKKSTKISTNKIQTVREIRNLLEKQKKVLGPGGTWVHTDKTKDAFKSLKKIESTDDSMYGTDMTGADALNLVWNRINNFKNDSKESEESEESIKERSQTLKENLLDELSDMQEHGHTVCAGGRFNRIIDTLNVVDPEVKIMPTHAVNQEMMTKSAKIRTDMLDEKSDVDKKKFEMGTHKDQDEFDLKLKDTIMDTLKKDYVETKILTEKKFKSEVGKWIEHI